MNGTFLPLYSPDPLTFLREIKYFSPSYVIVTSDTVSPTSLGPSNDKSRLVSFAPANWISSDVNLVLSIPNSLYNVCRFFGKVLLGWPAPYLAASTKFCSYFSPSLPPPAR